jgi:hypothetical protein
MFGSCLVLPLRTDRRPAGAIALYGQERHAFQGAAHDIALTFAAQGGTAMRKRRPVPGMPPDAQQPAHCA